jgi:hypothetical protein
VSCVGNMKGLGFIDREVWGRGQGAQRLATCEGYSVAGSGRAALVGASSANGERRSAACAAWHQPAGPRASCTGALRRRARTGGHRPASTCGTAVYGGGPTWSARRRV